MRFRWDLLLWVFAGSAVAIGGYFAQYLSLSRVIPLNLEVYVGANDSLANWPIEFGQFASVSVYSAAVPDGVRFIQLIADLLLVSIVAIGFSMAAILVSKTQRLKFIDSTTTRFLIGYGAWVVVASVLSEILRIVFIRRAVGGLELPTEPGEPVAVKLPEFALTPQLLFAISVGCVLIMGAIAIRRTLTATKELESVI